MGLLQKRHKWGEAKFFDETRRQKQIGRRLPDWTLLRPRRLLSAPRQIAFP
jgi:hypothetical protein